MRTKVIATFLPVIFCLALVVSVQAKSAKKSKSASASTTVTGCLQSGSSPNTFILSNTSSENMKSSNMSSSSRNQTPSEMARSEGSYNLIPQGNMDLQKWVGQRVQVTGKWAKPTSASSQGSSSSSMDNSSMSGSSDLLVTSVHKTSGTCK